MNKVTGVNRYKQQRHATTAVNKLNHLVKDTVSFCHSVLRFLSSALAFSLIFLPSFWHLLYFIHMLCLFGCLKKTVRGVGDLGAMFVS